MPSCKWLPQQVLRSSRTRPNLLNPALPLSPRQCGDAKVDECQGERHGNAWGDGLLGESLHSIHSTLRVVDHLPHQWGHPGIPPLDTTQSKAGSTLMMLSMLGLIIVLPLGLVMRHLMQYEW